MNESQSEPGEVIDIPSSYLSLSTKNQICVLAQAIVLIEDSSGRWWGEERDRTIEHLRRMQRDCRRRLRKKECPQSFQTSIVDYFGKEKGDESV